MIVNMSHPMHHFLFGHPFVAKKYPLPMNRENKKNIVLSINPCQKNQEPYNSIYMHDHFHFMASNTTSIDKAIML